ncbi:MAG: DUF58 domain-containing protein [Candidatus Melainabacteria bacterium]|nr:DUF58 domain-containing protein [Candidatus Melainabacteria bacterium]
MQTDPKTMGIVRDIARRVAAVKIPVGRLKSHQRLPGDRRSIHRGDGDDFDGHELYVPGDDPRTIDWNATAMTGGQHVLVALFKEEAHVKSTVLCDVSSTMNFGSTRVTKRILAAELAACAVRSLSTTHDPVAHVSYSQYGVERRIKSGSSASMMLPVILNVLKSSEKQRPGEHSGLAKSLATLPRSPSIVFIVSDFINTTEADWDALKRAGRKHRLIAMYVQDRRERELPDVGLLPVLYTVQDAGGVVRDVWVTRGRARKHAAQFKLREAGVLQRLKDCRAKSIVVSTDEGDTASLRVLTQLQAPTL